MSESTDKFNSPIQEEYVDDSGNIIIKKKKTFKSFPRRKKKVVSKAVDIN